MSFAGFPESSRIGRLLHAALRRNRGIDARRSRASRLWFLGLDVEDRGRAFSDERAAAVARDSAIIQAAERLGSRIGGAWRESATARFASALGRELESLPVWRRVRSGAMMLSSAVIVHLVLTRFSAPAPTVTTRVAWSLILGVLVAAMAGARGVEAAWLDRSSRREARRRSGRE